MKRVFIFFLLLGISMLGIFILRLNGKTYPIAYGISFNQNHASSLGLDWKEAYTAMLEELHPEYIRIAAMWSEVEQGPGVYDFSDVDWMMDRAAAQGTKVVLVVGQKAPRWPECHVPAWLSDYENENAARDHLFSYIERTVTRYREHSALEIWQVENEPFIRFRFGECENYREDFVKDEIAQVRVLDPAHRILVTDSGELSTWRDASRAGDILGTTLYRIVRTPRGMIWKHDWIPALFYRARAALWGRTPTGFFVSELQAEPWFTDAGAESTPLAEQEQTMNPDRLQKHLQFVTHVGASRAYLWGVEWWYFMKTVHGDSRYWEIVKEQTTDNRLQTTDY